jgi:hypothetical protein
MPYIYTFAREACVTGTPLVRSLVLEYQDDPGTYSAFCQYLLGRDMIISAVPDRIPEQVLKENAHMARTGLDLWDKWEWVKISFFMAAIVVKEAEPGYWPDMDMLPFGKLTVK